MIVTHDVETGTSIAQDMVAGMPPKTHRTVRLRGFDGNVTETLKEIQRLPQVRTAFVSAHTKDFVCIHIMSE